MSAVPLTVIAGYLGAGKTTVLNHLINNAGGRRLAVLVNDFGELNIDADLIADHDGNTYSLTNGCVCCTVGDDLGDVLQSIASDPNPPDEVFLEASGVTDGARFSAVLTDWHGLAARGAIVVVDAEAIRTQARDRFVGDMIERQLRAADLLVLNKADLVDEESLDGLVGWLDSIGASAPTITTTNGRLPTELLFGGGDSGGGDSGAGVGGDWVSGDEVSGEGNAARRADAAAAGDSAAHLAAFSSAVIRDDAPWDLDELGRALDDLSSNVVRVKGAIRVKGSAASDDGAFLLQMVGRRWRLDPLDEAGDGSTAIVVIAVDDDAASIADDLRRRLSLA